MMGRVFFWADPMIRMRVRVAISGISKSESEPWVEEVELRNGDSRAYQRKRSVNGT